MKIGAVIRKWRNASDVPLRELADEIGIPLSTLARVETGEECSGDTLAQIIVWLVKTEKRGRSRKPNA